jgi:hypothetical protein
VCRGARDTGRENTEGRRIRGGRMCAGRMTETDARDENRDGRASDL